MKTVIENTHWFMVNLLDVEALVIADFYFIF